MLVDDIALTMIPEVGTKTAIHLLECFGSAQAIFAASMEELTQKAELKTSIARSIQKRETHQDAEKEINFIEKHKIRAITYDSPEYPQLLKECNDYPTIIYVKGKTNLNSEHWLSVVGTRQITSYGAKACADIIEGLARMFPDIVIVSGLAYGVDIAAHRAALNSGLATVGVVAHALNKIYPPRHTESARRIVETGGAVLSEYHTGCNPDKSGFVQRNRIIAGLSQGTLIVESAAKGGSLITADMAAGYSRSVMAMPGRINDFYCEGTNNLIKSLKAEMVCSAEDIANALGWEIPVGSNSSPKMQFSKKESIFDARFNEANSKSTNNKKYSRSQSEALLAFMETGNPISLDELNAKSNIPINDLSILLLDLEFSGAIRSLPGKIYIKY